MSLGRIRHGINKFRTHLQLSRPHPVKNIRRPLFQFLSSMNIMAE